MSTLTLPRFLLCLVAFCAAVLPGRAEVGLQQHTALLEAMVRGDADEAERLRRENMRSAKSYLERYQKYIL